MFFIVMVVSVIGLLIWHNRKCNEYFAAINAWRDTGGAFTDWRLRNQGVYIGLSEEGRMLLGHYLDAYDWFLKTHKFIDGKKHREWLVSLFYDFPPKYPDGIPEKGKKGVQQDAFSFAESI